jgi:hypothetical protein
MEVNDQVKTKKSWLPPRQKMPKNHKKFFKISRYIKSYDIYKKY